MWRRRTEPELDRETVDGIIRKLMAIDEKLRRGLVALEVDDGEEDEENDT